MIHTVLAFYAVTRFLANSTVSSNIVADWISPPLLQVLDAIPSLCPHPHLAPKVCWTRGSEFSSLVLVCVRALVDVCLRERERL